MQLAKAIETTTDWLLGLEDHRTMIVQEVQRELMTAAGLPPQKAEMILLATGEALRLLSVLPGDDADPLRARMGARAAWHSQSAE